MKLKRYEAATLQEALLNVKKDLGSEAVILHTRKFNKGGVFGMFGRQMVEVTAGLDVNTANSTAAPARKRAPESNGGGASSSAPAAARKQPAAAASAPGSHVDSLREEMREVRDVLKSFIAQSSTAKAAENVQPFPACFGDIYLQLIENDVDALIAQEIIRSLNESVPDEDKDNPRAVQGYLARHLKRLLKVSGGIELTGGSPKTVALVGPTGVGKTTTIAKLATWFTLSRRKKVGLITSDTYRIAAVEQIKVYGEILDVPVKVAYNNEDMKRSLDLFSDKDLILIDTTGRSHRNTDKLFALKETLATHFPVEIHLVLNTNTRLKELTDITDKFRILPYNHIIFTKLDEASTYGNILNTITKFNLGVSYLSYGQSVPDELRPATYDLLVDLTLGKPLEKVLALPVV